ncbi:MAG TPA: PEGA domain-containing protein [Polyangiaceae bacterium]|jgi:hypothetical protein|nr:PEGA domain-containing protein [Polyangiaceae bacterium]
MSVRRLVALSCLSLGVTLSSLARADGYDSAVARAAAARDRALETGSAVDWREALELFGAAIEFNPTMDAKFEYAEASVRLDLVDEAFGAYTDALELGITGKARERAQAFVNEHEHSLGGLALAGPAGARIYVDERKRGTLPLAHAIPLVPGIHKLHADATGFRPLEGDITVNADQTTAITLVLEPAAAPAAPPAAAPAPPSAPRGPQDTVASSRGSWATPVLIAGGALLAGGAVIIVATTANISKKHDQLEEVCVVLEGDVCKATTAGDVSTAQHIGNDILAAKGLRWGGVAAAVVGLGAVGVSVFELATRKDDKKVQQSARVEVGAAFTGVRWRADF